MGLDMYAYTAPRHMITQDVDFDTKDLPKAELHYWRNHPKLHDWMSELYYLQGGIGIQFNRNPIALTLAILDVLEQNITCGELMETDSLFVRKPDGGEREDDLLFIKKARQAIAEGLAVYYDSWW